MDSIQKKEYVFSDDIGDAVLTVYQVFPGVQLAYSSVHMDRFDLGTVMEGNVIEIHYCEEGRIEQEVHDEYFYLMPGDFSITKGTRMADSYKFPLRHYHGIIIGIREDVAKQWFSQFLEDIHVQPLEVAQKLCREGNCFVIRSEKRIEHIFWELYSVPEHMKSGYFKLKILELFLVLSGIEMDQNQVLTHTLPKTQAQLAKQAAVYLSEHMERHVTISELSKAFHISQTQLKSVFKTVYGVPICSYMRIQKMQQAAQLLIHTERGVGEIACEFGYSNPGKFGAAFQKIMGETPAEYRKAHRKQRPE